MKQRTGFVSNSSSTSFLLRDEDDRFVDEDRYLLDSLSERTKIAYLSYKVSELMDLVKEEKSINLLENIEKLLNEYFSNEEKLNDQK